MMHDTRLKNFARLSVLYWGCLFFMVALPEIGIGDDIVTVIGILYFLIIIILEKFGVFKFFRGIALSGFYPFISLVVASYAFDENNEDLCLSFVRYIVVANFLFSCGYLIYVLHTYKPQRDDVGN